MGNVRVNPLLMWLTLYESFRGIFFLPSLAFQQVSL